MGIDVPPNSRHFYASIRSVDFRAPFQSINIDGSRQGLAEGFTRRGFDIDFAGQGVGTRLMTKLVAYARGRGVGSMIGVILSENKAMLSICRNLGFTIVEEPDEHDVKVARLEL